MNNIYWWLLKYGNYFVFRWCFVVYNVLVFSSITYALKAQGIFERNGIKSKLEKLKKDQSLNGCGYGLKLRNQDVINAKNAVEAEGIRIIEIFNYK